MDRTMLEHLLDGLALGFSYALLAAALTLVQVAWYGLGPAPGPVPDPLLRLPSVLLVALALVWLGRRSVAATVVALPGVPVLGWTLPPVLIAALAWLWWGSGLGSVWRAQAERPGAARELGLPVRRASLIALAVAAALTAAAPLAASGALLAVAVAPEAKALAASLAAGPGRPVAAAGLGLLAGLAEGGAMALAPEGSAAAGGGWVQAAAYALLLPFLLLRPAAGRWFEGEEAGGGD